MSPLLRGVAIGASVGASSTVIVLSGFWWLPVPLVVAGFAGGYGLAAACARVRS